MHNGKSCDPERGVSDKQSLNAVVTQCNEVLPGVMQLQVVPYGWDFPDYHPGQFAYLGLPGSSSRCAAADPETSDVDPEALIKRFYSIASSPVQHEYLEFFIALVPGGTLSPRLFNLKVGDQVWLSREPGGNITCAATQVPEDASLVLCTTDADFAPLVSMLTTDLNSTSQRLVALIHGVRNSWDLCHRSILMAMQHLQPNFTYLPVVSRPEDEVVPWTGQIGHVQDVWKSGAIEKAWGDRPQPDNTHVFLCGNPAMRDSFVELLGEEGFRTDTDTEIGQIHEENYWQMAGEQDNVEYG